MLRMRGGGVARPVSEEAATTSAARQQRSDKGESSAGIRGKGANGGGGGLTPVSEEKAAAEGRCQGATAECSIAAHTGGEESAREAVGQAWRRARCSSRAAAPANDTSRKRSR